MKKYLQWAVVAVLVLAVIVVARANSAWAGGFTGNQAAGVDNISQPKSIVVTGSGTYNIGGICTFEIDYKTTGLKDNVDSEVPLKESQQVPFNYFPDKLYFPGCHVVHYKNDQVVNQASTNDGKWRVCFGVRPNVQTKIYYYEDQPASGQRVWMPLPTTVENSIACADALYTGVYMPAGYVQPTPAGGAGGVIVPTPRGTKPGTVRPPAPVSPRITKSGTYSIGGICTMIVVYKQPNLSDDVWVELPTQDTLTVPFPSDKDILYFPGCHVVHYEPLMDTVTDQQGSWKICFAARPNKTMTIYYYSDDLTKITPPWQPLPTTTENGMACAPAMHSGVYTPAGQ